MNEYGASQPVPAIVTLVEGMTITGHLHVSPGSPRHPGAETPLELLNRREPFFPLTQEDGRAVFVAKRQVAFVECRTPPDTGDPIRVTAARQLPLEITLAGGRTLTGVAMSELPPGKSRASDFLNADDSFFALQTQDELLLINRAQVRVARSLR
jgi:hypothetical protein